MTKSTGHYEADRSACGDGDMCGHRHRTEHAAERCLARVPRSPSGSPTQNFSLAAVRWVGSGPDPRDEQDAAEDREAARLQRYREEDARLRNY